MEDCSRRHKNLHHLLAHPRVHHLRSLWHAVDRELGGYLVMRTRFRRKICASGTFRGGHTFFQVCSTFEQAAFFTQWLPQPQVVRPDFPPRKAMEASARDGLWSVRRRNVSARPISVSPFVPFSRCGALILKKKIDFFPLFFFFFFQSTPILSAQRRTRSRARPLRSRWSRVYSRRRRSRNARCAS